MLYIANEIQSMILELPDSTNNYSRLRRNWVWDFVNFTIEKATRWACHAGEAPSFKINFTMNVEFQPLIMPGICEHREKQSVA